MAKRTVYTCDCCGVDQEKPTIRICVQIYSKEKGYPAYITHDKWDVCSICGKKINDYILGLRREHLE